MSCAQEIAEVGGTRQLAIESDLHAVTIAGVTINRPSSVAPSVWEKFWEVVAKLRR